MTDEQKIAEMKRCIIDAINASWEGSTKDMRQMLLPAIGVAQDDARNDKLIAACRRVVDAGADPAAISNLWSVMMEMPVADFTVGSLAAVDLSAPAILETKRVELTGKVIA